MTNIQSIGNKSTILDDLNLHGYVRLPFHLSQEKIEVLRAVFSDNVKEDEAGKRFSRQVGDPVLQALKQTEGFLEAIALVLGEEAIVTRTLLLQKSRKVNWPLAWHQDVTILTKVSAEIPAGFGPVTYKNGLPHVTATEQFLAGMASVRIHLDDADKDSGALEIIPGSHKEGRIPPRTMEQEIMDTEPAYVPALAGEVHIFRPLLIHRSGKVKGDVIRRVIQLEMTPKAILPKPLEWYDPISIF